MALWCCCCVGWFAWWPDAARLRPDPSVGAAGASALLHVFREGSELVFGDVAGSYVAFDGDTIGEAASADEPAGAHGDVVLPNDGFDLLGRKGGCPCLSCFHFEGFRLG